MSRQLVSYEEAVEADFQHTKPCSDCPMSRKALPGWLGTSTPDEYVQLAHSDEIVECHCLKGTQCAGMAIYRTNVAKSPRTKGVLRLPADRVTVFATPMEFLDHHRR